MIGRHQSSAYVMIVFFGFNFFMPNMFLIASRVLLIFLLGHACLASAITPNVASLSICNKQLVTESKTSFYDKSRHRLIPVVVYSRCVLENQLKTGAFKAPVVIINHGYTAKNTEYSFLAKALATKGYFVVSIQHELAGDPPLAQTGNLYERRKPVWDNGVKNIRFVIQRLHALRSDLDLKKVMLIGHSNGGDMIMLFATQYPHSVSALIDLDSLRMPFPRTGSFPILTIRANDTKADEGVLPPQEELVKDNITVVEMRQAKHIDLCDRGSLSIKKKINQVILIFINQHK